MDVSVTARPRHETPTPPEPSLYATRAKVYPKTVSGTFRRIKWGILAACLAVYYLLPWVRWDRGPNAPDQALLIDMEGRRAYFFFIEIWPQEVYYLTGLLILAAIVLFLVTSLLGRVWCGYACPQTVWTDLFMAVERLIEGDRVQRMRLDKAPMSVGKLWRKAAKHGAWLLIAAATGGVWVMYFQDAPTLAGRFFVGEASAETYFFAALFTVSTYVLAGWAREQVCTYMCPWPRFQAAMLDEQSLIVTYQAWRGEPRGKHKTGESWDGRGDCVDCTACVQVCPTGIDIRDGQQLECIGCGLCIDACDEIMDKVGRPKGLVKLSTQVTQDACAAGRPAPQWRAIRPRTIIYAVVLATAGAVMLAALLLRPTVEITVLRDRNPLYVTLSDGAVRNAFTIKVLNKTRDGHEYALSAPGLPGATLTMVDARAAAPAASLTLAARPDSVATYRVFVTLPAADAPRGDRPLTFDLTDRATGTTARYRSVFIGPEDGSHHDEQKGR